MAHKTSAPALFVARRILTQYDLTPAIERWDAAALVRQKDNPTVCLAVIIDYATNVFQVVQHRPEVSYWQKRLMAGTATAPQIGLFVKKLLGGFDLLPKDAVENKITTTMESPEQFGGQPEIHSLTKASREAARFVYHYYLVTPKRKVSYGDENVERMQLARLVDAGLGVDRAMVAVPALREIDRRLSTGDITAEEIKKQFRELGVLLMSFPTYEDHEEQTKLLT